MMSTRKTWSQVTVGHKQKYFNPTYLQTLAYFARFTRKHTTNVCLPPPHKITCHWKLLASRRRMNLLKVQVLQFGDLPLFFLFSQKKPQTQMFLASCNFLNPSDHHVISSLPAPKVMFLYFERSKKVSWLFQFQGSMLSLAWSICCDVCGMDFLPTSTSFCYLHVSDSDWACLLIICSVICLQLLVAITQCFSFTLFLLVHLISVHVFCFGL